MQNPRPATAGIQPAPFNVWERFAQRLCSHSFGWLLLRVYTWTTIATLAITKLLLADTDWMR